MNRALHSLETAPFDDEPESEDEAAQADAALEELARGEFYTHAEIRRLVGLPAADLLARLDSLDDRQLWHAAHRTLPQRAARRFRALSYLQQQRTLTAAEERELTALLDRLEDVGLVRAKAAALLNERGHSITELVRRPPSRDSRSPG